MDYGNTKITQHALQVSDLHNAEVGHQMEEEETHVAAEGQGLSDVFSMYMLAHGLG